MIRTQRQRTPSKSPSRSLYGTFASKLKTPTKSPMSIRREEMDEERQQQKQLESLHFVDFMNSVLEFQMQEHKKYLDKFVKVFRSVDKLRTGVINETQFTELIYKLDLQSKQDEEQYIKKLLVLADPYKTEIFTFS